MGSVSYLFEMKNRLNDTGVDVDSGDEILMLSTCYRQIEQGRALVFARKERPVKARKFHRKQEYRKIQNKREEAVAGREEG